MELMGWIPEGMKLQGSSNYSVWAFRIKLVLMYEGLWDVIEPNANATPCSIMTSSMDVVEHNNQNIVEGNTLGKTLSAAPGASALRATRITTMEALKWISEGVLLEGSSNYLLWVDKMKRILMLEGVWEVVEKTRDPPSESILESSLVKEMQVKAMVLISFGVSDAVIHKFRHLSNPAAVWNILKTHYERAALFRLSRLR